MEPARHYEEGGVSSEPNEARWARFHRAKFRIGDVTDDTGSSTRMWGTLLSWWLSIRLLFLLRLTCLAR